MSEFPTLWKSDLLFFSRSCFKFVLLTMLFPFLCPKQKNELLFIALLALCKRGICSSCSWHSLQKEWQKWFTLLKVWIALSLSKKIDSPEKPKSKFPTLPTLPTQPLYRLLGHPGHQSCLLQSLSIVLIYTFSVLKGEVFALRPALASRWASSPGLGIRSFAHRSFALLAQTKWATVSDSLRSLKTNERP